MTRALAIGFAAAMLLSACGGSDDGGEASPRPPERLAEAVTALADANTGHFASRTAGAGGVLHSTFEGDYQLTPPAARATLSRYDGEGEARTTEVMAVGRDAWSRGADAGCWVHYDVTELFTNGLLVRNGDTYFPAPVAVAAFGRGVYSIAADQVSGTTELSTVLSVADLSLPSMLSLSRTEDNRVPATFRLDDGELAGWKVYVRDAVEKAREFAEPNPDGDGGVSALSVLGGTISDPGGDTHRGASAVDDRQPPRSRGRGRSTYVDVDPTTSCSRRACLRLTLVTRIGAAPARGTMMAAMKFRKELAYDADPADVFAMLSDPAFREKVARAQEVVSVDVQLTPSSGGFSLVNDQVQNTAGLPALAKKIAGDTTQAVITEEWSTPDGGSISITAPGKPTKAEGTIKLTSGTTGTIEVVELDVKVKVPLIGGKLEQLMADNIDSGFDVEHAVGQAWLAGER